MRTGASQIWRQTQILAWAQIWRHGTWRTTAHTREGFYLAKTKGPGDILQTPSRTNTSARLTIDIMTYVQSYKDTRVDFTNTNPVCGQIKYNSWTHQPISNSRHDPDKGMVLHVRNSF